MGKTTVLIVEDEAIVAADLAGKLEQLGYEVAGTAAKGEEAVELACALRPDIILMDIRLKGSMNGIEAAEATRRRIDVPVIYLTAHSDAATIDRAKLTEPFGYILKPFEERELATAIEMALYKHRADRRVREQREWLRVTLTSIGDAVIACDTDTRVTFLNPVAEALIGWKAEEASGLPLASVFRVVDERTGEPVEEPVARVLAEGRAVALTNHVALVTKTGSSVPIEDSAAPILDAAGRVIGAVLVFHDVTEKRCAEADRERLIAKLEAAVGELEGFTYSVSHDLRAPIRHIAGFAHLLKKDAWPVLSEQNRRYLDTILNSSRRMGVLVDELLEFSRMGRTELKQRAVDLDALVHEVVSDCAEEAKDRDVRWRIDRLPTVRADSTMMHRVFLNLIANALKFTRGRSPASVSIEYGTVDGEHVITVRDNGVGFDMRYVDKLFGIFQRLHTDEEFEGAGIGLANVQRIVHRHGGRIWAEGRINEGAAFSVALRKE